MASNNIEIEIQVKVEDVSRLISFLQKNATLKKEQRQIDEYFNPPHRDFTSVHPVKEWLRLRDENGVCYLNYKNWHYQSDGKSYSADEFEISIKDIDVMKKIFDALNFRHLTTINKKRRTWDFDDYEISVDEVANLGSFVEIEFKKQGNDKEITKGMIDFLKKIGVGKIQRNYQGYAFLMLFPKEAKYFEE